MKEKKTVGRPADPFNCKYVTLFIPEEIIPDIQKQIADWKKERRKSSI